MGMSMMVVGKAGVATKADESSYQNNARKSVQSPERIGWIAKQQPQYVGYHSPVNQHSSNEEDPLDETHIVDKAKGESKGNQLEDRGGAQRSFAKRPSEGEAVSNLS